MDRSLSGRHLGAAPSHAAEGFPGRWLGLVGSMWLLACAGNSYNFAIYSSDFKVSPLLSFLGETEVLVQGRPGKCVLPCAPGRREQPAPSAVTTGHEAHGPQLAA